MSTPNALQAALSKTVAIKVGTIFAPAVLLSFVGGMLAWRALQPAAENSQLDEKLAELSASNAQLKENLQQLVNKLEAQATNPQQTAQNKAQGHETTSKSKLAMLKRVLNDNIKLRTNA